MAYTQSGNKAVQKYSAKAYDRLAIRVKKGEADKIKAYAESKGYSLNGYINHLIDADMNRHQSETQSAGADTLELSEAVPTTK